ncbi:hypothetical protein [Serratia fonticola]|uniref:Uncharacterized protein n=1 Tax=Serratia fonticola TaxID=47917 RepID=A0ABY9PID5_SERFO|nr:hypothetical protein [Serratia fonticola]WMT13146.1 hypothetical protein RFB13_18150 [Serratia fonticola]
MVRNNGTQVRKDGTQKMECVPSEAPSLLTMTKSTHRGLTTHRLIRNPEDAAETPTIMDGRKKTVGRSRASSDVDHDPDDKKQTKEAQENPSILKSDQNGPTENAGIHAIQGKTKQSRWEGTQNEKIEPTIKIGLGRKACRCGSSIGQHKRREAWRTEQAGILYFGRC